MWQIPDILLKLINGRQALVLGVFDQNAEAPIQLMWVKKEKQEIKDVKHKSYETLSGLIEDGEVTGQSLPIILCIDNDHVIVELDEEALAAFEEEEFLIDRSGSEGGGVAVIRKEIISECLDALGDLQERVIDVHVGPIRATPWGQNLTSEDHIQLGNYQCATGEQMAYDKVETELGDPIVLEGKRYSPFQLLLVLSAFAYFMEPLRPMWQQTASRTREYFFGRLLGRMIPIGGGVLFGVFLLSTGGFFYFSGANEKLQEAYYEQDMLATKANNYAKDIQRLEEVLNTDGRSVVFSRISDDLGKTVPSKISLRNLNIFPANMSEMKRKKKVQPDAYVKVVGRTTNMGQVAGWVDDIKQLDWVADIKSHEVRKLETEYEIGIELELDHVE